MNPHRIDIERSRFGMGIMVGMSILSAVVGVLALLVQLSM